MFPYDPELLAAVQTAPQAIADVVRMLENIQAICANGDGLKWFNGLYLQVTQAVQARAALPAGAPGAFANAAWIAALDTTFAGFYFAALRASLAGAERRDAGRRCLPCAISRRLPASSSRWRA